MASVRRKGYQRVDNIDYLRCYEYYRGGGYYPIICNLIYHIATLILSMGFTIFLLGCVNWTKLFEGMQLWPALGVDGLSEWYIIIICMMFSLYLLWNVWEAGVTIANARKVRHIFGQILCVCDQDMVVVGWPGLVEKMCESFGSDAGEIRAEVVAVDELIKKIADVMNGVQPTPLVRWFVWVGCAGKVNLRRRFVYLVICCVLVSPLVGIFMCIHYIFQYGGALRWDFASVAGARAFTWATRVELRKNGEYPHEFEERMALIEDAANEYVGLFISPYLRKTAELIAYISGGLAGVLMIISMVEEDVWLNLEISPGRNVLWYLGVLAIIYGGARSCIGGVSREKRIGDKRRETMEKIITMTGMWEPHWEGRYASYDVYKMFTAKYFSIWSKLPEILNIFYVIYALIRIAGRIENINTQSFVMQNVCEPLLRDTGGGGDDSEMVKEEIDRLKNTATPIYTCANNVEQSITTGNAINALTDLNSLIEKIDKDMPLDYS